MANRATDVGPRAPGSAAKDKAEALAWVKKRARPRGQKHAALPEAEGAALNEESRPAKPVNTKRRARTRAPRRRSSKA